MKLSALHLLCVFIAMLLQSTAGAQNYWYVDDDAPGDPGPGTKLFSDPLENGTSAHPFDEIQEAISNPNTAAFDTILVRPGTYYENIDYQGKAITVRSDADGEHTTVDLNPCGTIIDGSAPSNPTLASCVRFLTGEGPLSILKGLTLRNGSGVAINTNQHVGGGVYCGPNTAPKIQNNYILTNSASFQGGGVGLNKALFPLIENNMIAGNSAGGYTISGQYGGGGMAIMESYPTVRFNLIVGNSAGPGGYPEGAGVLVRSTHGSGNMPILTNNTISGNVVSNGYGSGVSTMECSATIKCCIIWNNIGSYFETSWWGPMPAYEYCDVAWPLAGMHPGVANIKCDPLFVNPVVPALPCGGGDFRLQVMSCCAAAAPAGWPVLYIGALPVQLTASTIAPSAGPSCNATQIVISGTGFTLGASDIAVTVGGRQCGSVQVLTTTQLQCVVPAAEPRVTDGALDVVISDPGQSAVLSDAWRYTPNLDVEGIWAPGQVIGIRATGVPGSGFLIFAAAGLIPGNGVVFHNGCATEPSCIHFLLAPPVYPVFFIPEGLTISGSLPASWPAGVGIWFQGIEVPVSGCAGQLSNADT